MKWFKRLLCILLIIATIYFCALAILAFTGAPAALMSSISFFSISGYGYLGLAALSLIGAYFADADYASHKVDQVGRAAEDVVNAAKKPINAIADGIPDVAGTFLSSILRNFFPLLVIGGLGYVGYKKFIVDNEITKASSQQDFNHSQDLSHDIVDNEITEASSQQDFNYSQDLSHDRPDYYIEYEVGEVD